MATSLLDNFRCFVPSGNVGLGTCDIEEGKPYGEIFIKRGYVIPNTALQSEDLLFAELLAASTNDVYTDRAFPIYPFDDAAFSGEAEAFQTFELTGNKYKTRDATRQYDMTLVKGAKYWAEVKKTLDGNQAGLDVIRVTLQDDGTYGIWGTQQKDTNGLDGLGGFTPSMISVGNYEPRSGTTKGLFKVTVGYNNPNQFVNFRTVITDGNPFDTVIGIMSVNLSATSGSATTVHIAATTAWGKDLHEDYATELGVVSAFTAVNDDPNNSRRGNAITISAVASDATGWALTLAATGTDPDNPGSGKYVKVSLAAPSVLSGLDVEWYESIPVRVLLG